MNATPRAPSSALTRVLLVDGDPEDHRLLSDLLDAVPGTRFLIHRAGTVAEGRDRLDHARFDVCLLDLDPADGDGLDLLASAEALLPAMPVIVMAAAPMIDQDRRAMTLGAAAFLDKNQLDPVTLERVIRYAVHQRTIMTGLSRRTLLDDRTGLIGAALYRDRLNRALAFARRRDQEVAVVMIDLAFGPDAAVSAPSVDAALAEAGRRLASALRETDSIARLSDRRLVLLIEGMRSLDQAATVARKTLRLLRAPIEVDGQKIDMAASAGVAVYPREGGDADGLMRQAEAAMRRAIDEGGARCRFSSERVDYEAREAMVLERAFLTAFEHRDLRLRFHPELHFSDARAGLAAEIFWRHPDHSWLAIDGMQACTDDETLIKGIIDWTLAAAAEQLLAWRQDGLEEVPLSLAIPFRRGRALAFLESAVQEQIEPRAIDPGGIELDLQDELVLDDTRQGAFDLAALKATGVRLALDDVGQGRVALQDIRPNLLDGLKLAPDLCPGQQADAGSEQLVRALISFGHGLGLRMTAKGAADQRQLTLLKSLGCDAVLLSAALPPMSANAAAAWLHTTARRNARPAEIIVPDSPPLARTKATARPSSPAD